MQKCYILFLMVLAIILLIPYQVFAFGQMWGNDVLVHSANHIYGFGMDQGDKDTLVLVVSDSSTTNLKDTLYIYRSTNSGQSWNRAISLYSAVDNERFGKTDIIAAKGDSNFIFVFYMYDKKLLCAKYPYDLSQLLSADTISATGENVVDFSVCQGLLSIYRLYVVYQTSQDSVIFKCSTDYSKNWANRVNLTKTTPISQLSIASSLHGYLVVAGKTSDGKIYAIRNTNYGNSANWKNGQYPSGYIDCRHPVVAGSNTLIMIGDYDIFWVFYERLVATPGTHYILSYHYSTDGCATWSPMSDISDTSSGNRLYPSLHVLKETDASNMTLAYRYEGTWPHEIRYIYKEDAQSTPSDWMASYTGMNDYQPTTSLPHRAYTIEGTDYSINSTILYVRTPDEGLYFDASSFSGVDDEIGDETIKGFSLGQNYPNPFNPSTTIEYSLNKDGEVEIAVYNILGQKVKTLFEGYKVKGNHRIVWDGTGRDDSPVASGVYFYRTKSEGQTLTNKMVLTK
jgi:hypothetical protein